jgi:MFS family permease
MTHLHFNRDCRSLRKDLHYSALDGFLFSVAAGAGETFFPAFALAAGLGEIAAGSIAAIPYLAGAFLQLAAPRLVEKIGSCRRWIVGIATLQALSFAPLVYFAAPRAGGHSGPIVSEWLLYSVVTVYWFCSLAAGPSWNTWMSSIVPGAMRPKYFARRSRIGQAGLLLGLLCGGLCLHFAKGNGLELEAFAALFLISGFFRAGSAFCLSRQSEPATVSRQKRVPLFDLLNRLWGGADGRIILFMLAFGVAVNLSGPFSNPYLLEQLRLSYFSYMVLIALTMSAKIVVFAWIGEVARNSSPYGLMRLGALGAASLPLLWMVSTNYAWLAFVHIATGIAWAIYELGLTLTLFHAIRDDERTGFLSFYNFASALAVLGGTAIGAKLLSGLGFQPSTYLVVFALSAAARLSAFFILDRTVERIASSDGQDIPNPLELAVMTVRGRPRSKAS